MAKGKSQKLSRKKELRKLVSIKLEEVLQDIAPLLGKKKFEKRIKRASRLITTNLKPAKAQKSKDDKNLKPVTSDNSNTLTA